MASTSQKIEAEVRMRELLAENEMPAPDAVEYGFGCIRLFWQEPKVMVVVDIDDYSEVDARMGICNPSSDEADDD